MINFSRTQMVLVTLVLLLGMWFAAPNLMTRNQLDALPSWMPKNQVSLGLDLQGGSHLLLEVGYQAVVREHMESLVDTVRSTLRRANIPYTGLRAGDAQVIVNLREGADFEAVRELLAPAATGMTLSIGDTGQVVMAYTDVALTDLQRRVIGQSIEIIRRRIDETGTREPVIQRQGDDRIVLQLPGIRDPQRVKDLLGRTAKMTFHLVEAIIPPGGAEVIPPPNTILVPAAASSSIGEGTRLALQRRSVVTGENLVDAQATIQTGQPVVSFRFDQAGARRFGELTQNNVGRLFAIVLDNEVISAPRIRVPILGGSGIIEGGFTTRTAQDLAVLLRAGALPAPLQVLEERTVGADLGADSIAAGQLAAVIGFLAIMVAMVLFYGLFGLFSVAALLFNAVLLLAALSALQATLTLPGIAGIVLTLGMAVDANVLIFERIREEIRAGRSPIAALDLGYRGAWRTILDSNMTTLISTGILFMFGTGPIRGFAITLSIGILTSVFTAMTVTRLITALWFRRVRPRELPV